MAPVPLLSRRESSGRERTRQHQPPGPGRSIPVCQGIGASLCQRGGSSVEK